MRYEVVTVVLRTRVSAKSSENLLGIWHIGSCDKSFRVYINVILTARVAPFPRVS